MDVVLLLKNIKKMSKRGEVERLTSQAEVEEPELKPKSLVVYKSLQS